MIRAKPIWHQQTTPSMRETCFAPHLSKVLLWYWRIRFDHQEGSATEAWLSCRCLGPCCREVKQWTIWSSFFCWAILKWVSHKKADNFDNRTGPHHEIPCMYLHLKAFKFKYLGKVYLPHPASTFVYGPSKFEFRWILAVHTRNVSRFTLPTRNMRYKWTRTFLLTDNTSTYFVE